MLKYSSILVFKSCDNNTYIHVYRYLNNNSAKFSDERHISYKKHDLGRFVIKDMLAGSHWERIC